MSLKYFEQLFHRIYKFRAKLYIQEELKKYISDFPDTFNIVNEDKTHYEYIRDQIVQQDEINILALENFISQTQNVFLPVEIDIIKSSSRETSISCTKGKYSVSLHIFQDEITENLTNQKLDESLSRELKTESLKHIFLKIKEMELHRIINQPQKFYFFNVSYDQIAISHLLLGNYQQAYAFCSKNEKRIYCEIMLNRRLSLDEKIFNLLTEKDSLSQLNIDRLLLVFFVILYCKQNKNYTHYAFLYHFIEFNNKLINLVLSLELVNFMNILQTHQLKMKFYLYSSANILFEEKLHFKAYKIIEKHFYGDTLMLRTLSYLANQDIHYKQQLQYQLMKKDYLSSRMIIFKNLDNFTDIVAKIKLNYSFFKQSGKNQIRFMGKLQRNEYLLMKIKDKIKNIQITFTESKKFKKPSLYIEKDENIQIIFKPDFPFRTKTISFYPVNSNVKCISKIEKAFFIEKQYPDLKITNREETIYFNLLFENKLEFEIFSDCECEILISVNQKYEICKNISVGSNKIPFSVTTRQHLEKLNIKLKYFDKHKKKYIILDSHSYRVISYRLFDISITSNAFLNYLIIKIKNFSKNVLSINKFILKNDDYKIISFYENITEIETRIIDFVRTEYQNGEINNEYSILKNIPINNIRKQITNLLINSSLKKLDFNSRIEILAYSEKSFSLFFERSNSNSIDERLVNNFFDENVSFNNEKKCFFRTEFIAKKFLFKGMKYSDQFKNRILECFKNELSNELAVSFDIQIEDSKCIYNVYDIFFDYSLVELHNQLVQRISDFITISDEMKYFITRLDIVSKKYHIMRYTTSDKIYYFIYNSTMDNLLCHTNNYSNNSHFMIIKPNCYNILILDKEEKKKQFLLEIENEERIVLD